MHICPILGDSTFWTVFILRSRQMCLDVTSTHNLTTQHSDPHKTSIKFFVHCDGLLLWHFDNVTMFYCNIPTQSGWMFVHLKKWTVGHCVTFQHTVILSSPWLWHFVLFWFWLLLRFFALKRDSSMRFLSFEGTVTWCFLTLVWL
jgi:hypothetical protein